MTESLFTIEFIIPTENAPTVVTLLISSKIPFMLVPANIAEIKATNSSKQIEPIKVRNKPLTGLMSERAITEAIYRKYIQDDIETSPPTETRIAAEFGVSLNWFKKAFRKMYGEPFYQLYMKKKMEHATCLLREGYKVSVVAKRIGYSQPIKFTMIFQKYFGISPKKYQMSQK